MKRLYVRNIGYVNLDKSYFTSDKALEDVNDFLPRLVDSSMDLRLQRILDLQAKIAGTYLFPCKNHLIP